MRMHYSQCCFGENFDEECTRVEARNSTNSRHYRTHSESNLGIVHQILIAINASGRSFQFYINKYLLSQFYYINDELFKLCVLVILIFICRKKLKKIRCFLCCRLQCNSTSNNNILFCNVRYIEFFENNLINILLV